MAAPHKIAERETRALNTICQQVRQLCQRLGLKYAEPNTRAAYGADFNRMLRLESAASWLTQSLPAVNDTASAGQLKRENTKLAKDNDGLRKLYADAIARAEAAEKQLDSIKSAVASTPDQ